MSGAGAARQSLWTRSFIIVSLVNFLNSVVFLLLMIVMSKVATDRFDAEAEAVTVLGQRVAALSAQVEQLQDELHELRTRP